MLIKKLSETVGECPRMLIHGPSGVGKTKLIQTLAEPATDAPPVVSDPSRILIVSAERGLLSIAGFDASVVEVSSTTDRVKLFGEVLKAAKAGDFDAIAIDSITEIGNMSLAAAQAETRDGRAAYGEMMGEIMRIYRGLRMMPVTLYVIAQSFHDDGEWHPMMPGSKVGPALTYEYDVTMFYRVVDAESGPTREIVTGRTGGIEAKDRSGRLALVEPPCLSHILHKIRGAR